MCCDDLPKGWYGEVNSVEGRKLDTPNAGLIKLGLYIRSQAWALE